MRHSEYLGVDELPLYAILLEGGINESLYDSYGFCGDAYK